MACSIKSNSTICSLDQSLIHQCTIYLISSSIYYSALSINRSTLASELRSLSCELLRYGKPCHNIQLDWLFATHEIDFLNQLEPKPLVQLEIARVAALEVADAVFHIGLFSISVSI